MRQIASQPLGKSYVSDVLSRSFFVSYFCYILILVIPATLLINIQYSWPSYKRQTIQPTITYQAYQLSCLNSANQLIYNSNIEFGKQAKDHTATLSVGIKGKKLYIFAQIFSTNIKTCTAQIYLKSKIGSSVQLTSHLPINIVVPNNLYNLANAQIKGTITLKSSIPISQSSLLAVNQSNFGTYPFSFSGNYRSSGDKSAILDVNTIYNKISTSATTTNSFSFVAEYQILSDVYLLQSSLIDKLRTFIPIFMYISLFLWWIIVDPLVNWMFNNRVYSAKPLYQKIKKD